MYNTLYIIQYVLYIIHGVVYMYTSFGRLLPGKMTDIETNFIEVEDLVRGGDLDCEWSYLLMVMS